MAPMLVSEDGHQEIALHVDDFLTDLDFSELDIGDLELPLTDEIMMDS